MQADYEGVPAVVAIEIVDSSKSKLIVNTPKYHPQNAFSERTEGIIPSEVARWIQQSIELGWNPDVGGVTFVTVSDEGALQLQDK